MTQSIGSISTTVRRRFILGRQGLWPGRRWAGKDTGVALYYLWLTGELMTHHRHGKERVYDFLENVAPTHLHFAISEKESEEFFVRKAIAHLSLINARTFRAAWKSIKEQPVNLKEAQSKLDAMAKSGRVAAFQLEGADDTHYCLAPDLPLLETIQRGEIPHSWQPLENSALHFSLARFTNFLNANRLNSTILKPNFLRQKVDKEFAHN